MVRPTQLGSTLTFTGPTGQLTLLRRDLLPGDLVISQQPHRITVNTLNPEPLLAAARVLAGVGLASEVPNVQGNGPDRRARR